MEETHRRILIGYVASMADVEASSPGNAAAEPLPTKDQPKRRRLFFLFGGISITWCTVLVWVMQGLTLSEHQRLEDGFDFKGADIDSEYGVTSASACSKACERHPRCLALTYVKSEEVCWFKGEGYISKSNPNTVSGTINATLASERRALGNASKNWDDGDWKPPDPYEGEGEESSNRQAEDAERHWGDDDMGSEEGERGLGDVVTTDYEVERYEDATSFFGDLLVTPEIRSASECESICSMNGQCVAWTLDKYKYLCMMRLLNASLVRSARAGIPTLLRRCCAS